MLTATTEKNFQPGKLAKIISDPATITFHIKDRIPYEQVRTEFTKEEIVVNTDVFRIVRIARHTIVLLVKEVRFVEIKEDRKIYNEIFNADLGDYNLTEVDKENSQYPYLKTKWWLTYIDGNQNVPNASSFIYNIKSLPPDQPPTGMYFINPGDIEICHVED